MGKVIAPLAEGVVPSQTIFDRRLVIECCERFHIHWRNMRLELTAENWKAFVSTFESAIAKWRECGSPDEHMHLELAKYMMDTNEIVHPMSVGVELCENLYKSMKDTHGADADFWDEDAFVHFHYRDMRFEMSVADFMGFSTAMSSARHKLQVGTVKPLADLFALLNEHNILYVVLRNWELLPDSVEVGPHSDLDLLIHPAHVAKFDALWNAVKTHTEDFRVQRRVPVLDDRGQQNYILVDVRTTDDGYMPESFSHALLARRRERHTFFVLPDREYFLSLLYHAVVHKGFVSDEYGERLRVLAESGGVSCDPAMFNCPAYLYAFMAQHDIHPTVPDDRSVLQTPKLVQSGATATASVAPSDVPPKRVLAFVDELLEDPSLLETFARVFRSHDNVQLVAYAPNGIGSQIGPILEQLLVSCGVQDRDTVLLAIRESEESERTLAGSVDVLLSSGHYLGPLAAIPRLSARVGERIIENVA